MQPRMYSFARAECSHLANDAAPTRCNTPVSRCLKPAGLEHCCKHATDAALSHVSKPKAALRTQSRCRASSTTSRVSECLKMRLMLNPARTSVASEPTWLTVAARLGGCMYKRCLLVPFGLFRAGFDRPCRWLEPKPCVETGRPCGQHDAALPKRESAMVEA